MIIPANPADELLPVSVILAAPGDSKVTAPPIGHDEFERQVREAGGELIVSREPNTLTPRLWAAGLKSARGRVIVFTLAGLLPREGWLAAHVRAHESGEWAAVGGSIDPDPNSSRVERAIALCRYSAVTPPFEAHAVGDIAADNASYRRDAIAACEELIQDGFWEPPVHARLRGLGKRLLLDSAPGMIHVHTDDFDGFIRQRLKHGFRYGRDRRREVGAGFLAKYFLLCPALPLVLTARVFSRLKSRGRPIGETMGVLPQLMCFNIAWTIGEVAGMIAGPSVR